MRRAPRAATHVRTLDFADQVSDENAREVVFVAELWQDAQRLALQVASFAPTKHLSLADPGLMVALHVQDGQFTVNLATTSLARLVELSLDGADTIFSDYYFDLPAGRTVTVTCPIPAGWSAVEAEAALCVRSVYDSYTHAGRAR